MVAFRCVEKSQICILRTLMTLSKSTRSEKTGKWQTVKLPHEKKTRTQNQKICLRTISHFT